MKSCIIYAMCALCGAGEAGGTVQMGNQRPEPAPLLSTGPSQAGAARPAAQRSMSTPLGMIRPALAYEVEQLRITPGDPAGLAAWAELAAQGFHLISVAAQDGAQVLFFERTHVLSGTGIRLPAALAADAALAQPLAVKLQQILIERQQAIAAERPSIAPLPNKEAK
jgi:hypothetical protein